MPDGTVVIADEPHLLARPSTRFWAQFLDELAACVIFIVPLAIVNNLGVPLPERVLMLPVVGAVLYFLLQDGLPNGQSLGKILMRIQVIDERTGKPCGFGQSVLRNAFLFLGLIDVLFMLSGRRQRLGDRVAHTLVVHTLVATTRSA